MPVKLGSLRAVVASIDNIPTLPRVVMALMEAMENPGTSSEDVNQIILSDSGLTGKVLRLINSAFYGFPRKIGNVTEAVVVLGFSTVKNLAISASVLNIFGKGETRGLDREAFWMHCLGTGVIARIIGKEIKYKELEDLFVAGLLHDIGKMIFDQFFQNELLQVTKEMKKNDLSMREAEINVIGVSHDEVGGWLAKFWNLPDELSDGIRHHHDPFEARKSQQVAAVIHLANFLCQENSIGNGGNARVFPLVEGCTDLLDLKESFFTKISNEVEDEMEKASIFLKG